VTTHFGFGACGEDGAEQAFEDEVMPHDRRGAPGSAWRSAARSGPASTPRVLAAETARESASQGEGDTELTKLCCVQLFNSGERADTLLIWRAKAASFGAASSNRQLLYGAL
jgi:hypothetical protein